MSQVAKPEADARILGKPVALVGIMTIGAALGLLAGLGGLVCSMAVKRWSIHEVPLLDFVVVFPVLGAIAGNLLWRMRRLPGMSEPGAVLVADTNASDEVVERRRRRRGRFLFMGLLTGCGTAFLATLADFAWRGWVAVGTQSLVHMFVFPYFCTLIAFNLSRAPGEKFSLRDVRWSIRSIMVLVAYLALLFGVGAEGQRIGGAAERFHNQYLSSVSQAELFEGFAKKFGQEAPVRRRNAAELRAGRIPDHILEVQRSYLKSLEKTATPDFRKYRYGLIADGEDLQGQSAESNIKAYTQLVRYYDLLADKYAKAEKQPWKPVPPDPPRP